MDGEVALHVLDLVGTFVFGITGALVGVRKQLDLYGIQVLAWSPASAAASSARC